ncbi:hypothetical protein F4779DRAFT_436445 [Xylariaceae sp. FL0662B]|nr:hypothetical protein F4779DRAFT_436445 [Xylariaceae sp. FL0662B]
MFSTLRSENSGNGLYVLESNTGSPFDNKNRQNKTVRIACDRCRWKKLKCTSEKDGCRRCSEKKWLCSYTSSAARPKTSPHTESLSNGIPLSPETSESFTPRSAPEVVANGDSLATALDLPSDTGGYGSFNNADIDLSVAELLDMTPSLDDISSLYAPCAPFSDSSRELPTPNISDTTGQTPTRSGCDDETNETRKCSCPEKVVRTYEMVEICLVWELREPSSLGTDEMLRYQKEALMSCESFLACDTCVLQSEYAMIIIKICNKLLVNIAEISAISSNTKMNSHRPREASLAGVSTTRTIENRRKWKAGQNDDRLAGWTLGSGIDQWRIDDEDKLEMLTSLLNGRITRLRSLINRLEEIAILNCWLAHKRMIRDLMGRFVDHFPPST